MTFMGSFSRQEIVNVIDRILRRVEDTAKSNPEGFPHYSDDFGRWICTPDGDWTGGFWVGLLWLSYVATGDERFLSWAKKWMRKLQPRVLSETVFRCFLFYYGAAVGDILTDDRECARLAVAAARGISTLYNHNAKVIPLGRAAEEASSVGLDQTNVDSVITTALLSYAAEKTNDVELKEIGMNHALAHINYCVMDDGSVLQSATFDPTSGRLVKRYTHKGYADNTVWARAQAWAMLGFTQAAKWAPKRSDFLEAAVKVSYWWMKNMPKDFVVFWDFNDPRIPNTLKDTSATAIAATSLLKLSKLPIDDKLRSSFQNLAVETIKELTRYVTPVDEKDDRPPGMLTCGCYNRRIALATCNELVWGDYYLLESMLTLENKLDKWI
ncbi:MAG: hypothetical protein QW470_00315 [Candidatus Caldarchaeum sp.]